MFDDTATKLVTAVEPDEDSDWDEESIRTALENEYETLEEEGVENAQNEAYLEVGSRVIADEVANSLPEDEDELTDEDMDTLRSSAHDFLSYNVPPEQVFSNTRGEAATLLGYDSLDDMFGQASGSGGTTEGFTPLSECTNDDEWVNVRARVLRFIDTHNVEQMAVLEDESGQTVISAFESEPFEEGESYEIRNVPVNSYENDEGEIQYSLNFVEGSTEFEQLDEDIRGISFTGAVVHVGDYSGNGLIERDPDSGSVVTDGTTFEGKAVEDTEEDLRIRFVMDDGHEARSVTMNADVIADFTEEVQGEPLTVEKAEEMATEALDRSVVTEELRDVLMSVGYLDVDLNLAYDKYFVEDFTLLDNVEFERESIQNVAEEIEVI